MDGCVIESQVPLTAVPWVESYNKKNRSVTIDLDMMLIRHDQCHLELYKLYALRI